MRPAVVAFAALLLVGCGSSEQEPPLRSGAPVVDRQGGSLTIRWSPAWSEGRVDVFVGDRPDAVVHDTPIATTHRNSVRFPDPDPRVRHYFAVVPEDGAPRITAERKLPLRGAYNFRDLGGYGTRDGRIVRWGRLFRSDALADLTDADLAYLEQIGLRLVCDFRSDGEVASEPDRLPPGTRALRLPIQDEALEPLELQRMILDGDTDFDGAELLRIGNQGFVRDFSEHWRQLLARVADPAQLPTLVHCTAGKDRAGYAAALLLLVLGVPEETIYDDYLRTNVYSASHTARTTRIIWLASRFRTPPERSLPLFEARREYLAAAFAAIREDYGSIDAYLKEALALSAEELEALRAQLTSATGA